ncbi:hypothetical protein G5B41_17595 [bacterium SGD-2]|nr:hypothetical protein [bacterium SGD-2]
MTTATDQFLMFVAVFVLAYIAHRIWRYFFPDGPAEPYGYAPGSEDIPLSAVIGALVVVAVLVFGVAHVGAAAGL